MKETEDDFSGPDLVQTLLQDQTNRVRVATAQEFVGRRRLLQGCVRELRSGRGLGILLHGIGGAGKCTVAAPLLERLSDYNPIVNDG